MEGKIPTQNQDSFAAFRFMNSEFHRPSDLWERGIRQIWQKALRLADSQENPGYQPITLSKYLDTNRSQITDH